MSWRRLSDWFVPLRSKRSKRAKMNDGAEAKLSLLRDEGGATFVEYISIVVVIAVFGISAWTLWKEAVKRDASEQYTTFGSPPDE